MHHITAGRKEHQYNTVHRIAAMNNHLSSLGSSTRPCCTYNNSEPFVLFSTHFWLPKISVPHGIIYSVHTTKLWRLKYSTVYNQTYSRMKGWCRAVDTLKAKYVLNKSLPPHQSISSGYTDGILDPKPENRWCHYHIGLCIPYVCKTTKFCKTIPCTK